MEQPKSLAALLERALSAEIAHRCQRAYVHEAKNGLQPIYSGLEALNRALRPVVPGSVVERCLTLTRQALSHHEQALERSLSALTGADRELPQRADVRAVLTELSRFMASDAAFHDVRLNTQSQSDPTTSAEVLAVPGLLRLVLLGVLVDCIDSQPQGGEVTITVELAPTTLVVQFLDTRPPASAWLQARTPEAVTASDYNARLVVKMLVASLDGVLEAAVLDDSQHRLRLTLPRAAESA